MKNFISILFVSIFLVSCNSIQKEKISNQKVKDKVYEFFETLSVKNPNKEKLYDLITKDYYIFENQKKYTMQEFLEFVSSFNIIQDNWELSNFDINTDYNSAHVTLKNKGEFIVKTPDGNVKMEFEWLESAYLIKENDELKFKFYFSDTVSESVIPL
tara:strand:+ start:107 stop:577 length:471 start_codon:yes stop_codon:yes gene_type:complete